MDESKDYPKSTLNQAISSLPKENEVLIPADGNCLYVAVFLGYVMSAVHDAILFRSCLIKLVGQHNGGNSEQLRLVLLDGFNNIELLQHRNFKELIKIFKQNMGLNNSLWGGANEITILAQRLHVAIQEVMKNQSDSAVEVSYVQLDRTSPSLASLDPEEQFDTIFILRTNAIPREAVQAVADPFLQIGQMESAAISNHSQHYRLILMNSVIRNIQNAQKNARELTLQSARFNQTVSAASGIVNFFQKLFNPPQSNNPISQPINTNLIQQAIGIITGHHTPGTLMSRASEFVSAGSQHPALKSSEYKMMEELLVRTGMQVRPEYFTPLEEETVSSDTMLSIGINFFREFTQLGSLDRWTSYIRRMIEDKKTIEPLESEAALEFLEQAVKLLKLMGSDAAKDPTQNPLNKYVNSQDIKLAQELYQWLEENYGHSDYDRKQRELMIIVQRISSSNERVMKEGGEYMFSLLQRMQPEFADAKSTDDITSYQRVKHTNQQYQEFKDYILKESDRRDIFEPNQLRAFWESLYRNQYGKFCYKVVCESFEEDYKSSSIHQIVQQIWTLSLLDTIHVSPQDAKSRMPGVSVDGLAAPNFGYAMARSEAYQYWIENSLARACGDIIVDAFHFVVDFGRQLDIGIFSQRFKKCLSNNEEEMLDRINNPHEYDSYMMAFYLYLLEKVFATPYVNGRNIPKELKKAAGSRENLTEKAEQALNNLKNFSHSMFALRPEDEKVEEDEWCGGLVLGIGFNGQRFNSLTHSRRNKDEIWLSFPESGRKPGGYLLLSFVKDTVARQAKRLGDPLGTPEEPINLSGSNSPKLASLELEKSSEDASQLAARSFTIQRNFEKYKPLIRLHVNQKIKDNYNGPDWHWTTRMLLYVQKKRDKYEDFMSQLEQEITFDKLDPKFKAWILHTANWYGIASVIKVKIPDEMPSEEHAAQRLAREVLFDAIAQRVFSSEHADLMPSLFVHWKEEVKKLLLADMTTDNSEVLSALQTSNKLEEVPEHFRKKVLTLLDSLIWQVHPDLKPVWDESITTKFQEFMSPRIKKITDEIKRAEHAIKNANKNLKQMSLSKAQVVDFNKTNTFNAIINAAQQKLAQAQQRLKGLPKNFTQLSSEEFQLFRTYFFEERSVSQCVEPIFARVLGHDRFFSVYLSKREGKGSFMWLGTRIPQSVIPPCDNNCQHHVLGHVYTGDILSYQSADRLDRMRQTHGMSGVPNRIMTDIEDSIPDKLVNDEMKYAIYSAIESNSSKSPASIMAREGTALFSPLNDSSKDSKALNPAIVSEEELFEPNLNQLRSRL